MRKDDRKEKVKGSWPWTHSMHLVTHGPEIVLQPDNIHHYAARDMQNELLVKNIWLLAQASHFSWSVTEWMCLGPVETLATAMTASTKDCTESLSCSRPGLRDHPTVVTEVPYVIHEAQMWSHDQCTWWPHTRPNLVSFKTPYTDRSGGWNHLWQWYQFWLVSALDEVNEISSAQICQIWLKLGWKLYLVSYFSCWV